LDELFIAVGMPIVRRGAYSGTGQVSEEEE
jgi:hypothetical protein